MIYKFRLITNEVEDFYCDIAIKSEQTFYDFHKCIQDAMKYESSQLASFFLTNKNWEKQLQITLIDMNDVENEMLIMDTTIIGDHIKSLKQKLLYVFDFFSERTFFVELVEIKAENKNKPQQYPICVALQGEPPKQIQIKNVDIDKILDDDEELYEDDAEPRDLDEIENFR